MIIGHLARYPVPSQDEIAAYNARARIRSILASDFLTGPRRGQQIAPVSPSPGWEDRAVDRAKAEGVLP